MVQLSTVPTVIDPVVGVLEIRARLTGGEVRPVLLATWPRQSYEADDLPFIADYDRCNIYGDQPAIKDCQVLLVYTSTGKLSWICCRDDVADSWSFEPVGAEATGELVTEPSVRLSFETQREADEFTRWIEGKMRSGTRLGRLVRRIRQVAVSPVAQPAER